MKSSPGRLGDINLRGKKSKVLRCGCCIAQDFRKKEKEREDRKEINEAYCNLSE